MARRSPFRNGTRKSGSTTSCHFIADSSTTRSATSSTKPRSWLTTRTPRPLRFSCRIETSDSIVDGAMLFVGSSRM